MKEDCIHFYGSLCFVPYFNWIFFIISHLDILGCLTVFYSCSTLALEINIIHSLSYFSYYLMRHQCQIEMHFNAYVSTTTLLYQ